MPPPASQTPCLSHFGGQKQHMVVGCLTRHPLASGQHKTAPGKEIAFACILNHYLAASTIWHTCIRVVRYEVALFGWSFSWTLRDQQGTSPA